MKKMTTTIIESGKEKRISVWLDERTVEALEQANDAALTQQYIIDKYKSSLVDRSETRRHQSLDVSMDNGFEPIDERDYASVVLDGIEHDRLRAAFAILTNEQRELIRLVYFAGVPQKEIAERMGLDKTSVRDRLKTIYKKISRFLED